MTRQSRKIEGDRPPLRGICIVVKDRAQRLGRREPRPDAGGTAVQFPTRPDCRVLSESIPLFFIARNKNGLWVAREAEGRSSGIFLFKRSALRFAQENSAPTGCATMVLGERLELDVANHGHSLVMWLNTVLRTLGSFIPDHPPPIPIRRRLFAGDQP
jgi:hypothetical protein